MMLKTLKRNKSGSRSRFCVVASACKTTLTGGGRQGCALQRSQGKLNERSMDLVIRESRENISQETETEIRLKGLKGEWGRTERNWDKVEKVWVTR